uniref:Uncharacterized protein n=1 Tax=Felis catus TaxID=9685 RepID=A0ABI7ZNQ6_FELCA
MFSETSFPLETASPLPPFTSSSCLAFFASSFRGLSSSGFLFFLTRWEISVTQLDEEAPSVGFLLATMETEVPPPLGVKPEVELSTRVAFRANSAPFPLRWDSFASSIFSLISGSSSFSSSISFSYSEDDLS